MAIEESRVKSRIGPFSVLWFFLLLASGGCLLGGLAYFIFPSAPFRSWDFWAKPPSQAIKLLPPKEYDTVFVQSIDGNIYSCKNRNECEQVENLPEANLSRSSDAPITLKPIVPGKVIDSLSYRAWGIDSYVDIHLVILEDGTIWEWRNSQDALFRDMSKILTYASSGALLSIFLGFVVYRSKYPKL